MLVSKHNYRKVQENCQQRPILVEITEDKEITAKLGISIPIPGGLGGMERKQDTRFLVGC